MESRLEDRFQYWKDRSHTEFALDKINDEFFDGKMRIYYKDIGSYREIVINDRNYKNFDQAFEYIKEMYCLQNIKDKINNAIRRGL